jgi:hypothetical protein
MLATEKSTSLFVSEVCRAWMANDASWIVLDAGSAVPDPETNDGRNQAKCARVVKNGLELDGGDGNVDDEGTQKVFGTVEAPKGVVFTKGGANAVWTRSSSL